MFACLFDVNQQVGSLDKSKKSVGTGLVGAPACGDVMKLQVSGENNGLAWFTQMLGVSVDAASCSLLSLQIEVDASGVISNAVFKTFG